MACGRSRPPPEEKRHRARTRILRRSSSAARSLNVASALSAADQMGVVTIAPDGALRWHCFAVRPIVRQIEEAATRRSVAVLPWARISSLGSVLPYGDGSTTNPPLLDPTGTMTTFWTSCAFTQPQYLGAEVVTAVAPTQTATGHPPNRWTPATFGDDT